MESVGFFEAWQLWASGEKVEDLKLWWWSILWWGRAGKILGLVAFVALVAEIAGPDRLKKWGNSLGTTVSLRYLTAPARLGLKWAAKLSSMGETGEMQDNRHSEKWVASSAFLFGVGGVWLLYKWWVDWCLWCGPAGMDALFGVLFAISAIITAVWLSSYMLALGGIIAGGLAGLFLVGPGELLAAFLRRENVTNWVRGVTGFFILIGFHFDLLAS